MKEDSNGGCMEIFTFIILALILMCVVKKAFPELSLVWVLAPLWIPVALCAAVVLIIIVAAVIKWFKTK